MTELIKQKKYLKNQKRKFKISKMWHNSKNYVTLDEEVFILFQLILNFQNIKLFLECTVDQLCFWEYPIIYFIFKFSKKSNF